MAVFRMFRATSGVAWQLDRGTVSSPGEVIAQNVRNFDTPEAARAAIDEVRAVAACADVVDDVSSRIASGNVRVGSPRVTTEPVAATQLASPTANVVEDGDEDEPAGVTIVAAPQAAAPQAAVPQAAVPQAAVPEPTRAAPRRQARAIKPTTSRAKPSRPR